VSGGSIILKRWQKRWQKMQKQNMPKRSTVLKSVKQDNNCQLILAFANAVHDPSDKFYGDEYDEDDNFHIQ
jgi:hypothetical protein